MKCLPEQAMKLVFILFYKIWEEGRMPKSLKRALILPFNKPGKDPHNAGNYKPIAYSLYITSHLCKWMETILNWRLNYFIERKWLIAPYQSGFWKGRSAMDAIVRVSNEIEKTFKIKELMCSLILKRLMIPCRGKGFQLNWWKSEEGSGIGF